MSHTPRTDDIIRSRARLTRWAIIEKCAEFEAELNAANDRIKRLEEALDTLTLVLGLTPIAGNKEALQEAVDLARNELKAKEDKP